MVKWPPTRKWKGHFESPGKEHLSFEIGKTKLYRYKYSTLWRYVISVFLCKDLLEFLWTQTKIYTYIYIHTHKKRLNTCIIHTVNIHILYLSLSVTYLDCKSHLNHHQARNCHRDFLAPTLSPYGEGADGSPGAPWKLADQDFDLDPKTDNSKRKMLGGKVQKVEKVTKKNAWNMTNKRQTCFFDLLCWNATCHFKQNVISVYKKENWMEAVVKSTAPLTFTNRTVSDFSLTFLPRSFLPHCPVQLHTSSGCGCGHEPRREGGILVGGWVNPSENNKYMYIFICVCKCTSQIGPWIPKVRGEHYKNIWNYSIWYRMNSKKTSTKYFRIGPDHQTHDLQNESSLTVLLPN